jgi:predicted choloylglycine hydrolase
MKDIGHHLQNTSARFRSISEARPGAKLAGLWQWFAPGYRRWYLRDGDKPRPSYARGLTLLRSHMPELLPTFEQLLHVCAADELTARFLTLYDPPAIVAGCSQAVWTRGETALIRNYDFPAGLCESVLLHSNWNGTAVIAMTDCFWGVLDGINEHGLSVSLAYGGRRELGRGFSITLILRYILEFCQTVEQATDVLHRIPVQLSYNVTLVDRQGNYVTVLLSPDRDVQVTHRNRATNHQHPREVNLYECLADSRIRENFLAARLDDQRQSFAHFQQLFLLPPLYRYAAESRGWGTLYTSTYFPAAGYMELHWPDGSWRQGFDHFVEQERTVVYQS